MKKQKHLKKQGKGTSPAVHETLVQLDAQRLRLSQEIGQAAALKAEYMDGINEKRSLEKCIAEQQQELDMLKPKPKVSEVVKSENLNLQPQKPQKPEFEPPKPSFVNRFKPK